jgi:hypothetical protein
MITEHGCLVLSNVTFEQTLFVPHVYKERTIITNKKPKKCTINDSNVFVQDLKITGRAMAQAVSRRPLTAETRVRSQVNPCEICGGQSGTGTGFSPSCRFSLVNFIPLVLH